MWDIAIFCGTEQSCNVGKSSLIWYISLMWDQVSNGGQSSVRLSSLIWDRAVLCKKEESYVRQESYMEKSGLLCPSPVL